MGSHCLVTYFTKELNEYSQIIMILVTLKTWHSIAHDRLFKLLGDIFNMEHEIGWIQLSLIIELL